MEENKIILECPICHQNFSMDQLINHNEQALMDYINNKTDKILEQKSIDYQSAIKKELEQEYVSRMNQQQASFDSAKSALELDFSKKEALITSSNKDKEFEMQQTIISLNNEIQNLKDSLEDKIEISKQQINSQYTEQIVNKDKTIAELENNLRAKQLEFNQQLSEKQAAIDLNREKTETLIKDRELQIINDFNKKIDAKNEEINELKMENSRNKILNSKVKGENFEHEVEGELRKAFGFIDKVEKINETINNKKADFLQVVQNQQKEEIGKIVYEVKNAKWSESWIPKLVQDVANNKTKYGILIATTFNERYHEVPFIKSDQNDDIFITDPYNFVFVAQLLRRIIVIENEMKVREKQLNNTNDAERISHLQHQVDIIKEFMQNDLPKYQVTFNKQLKDIDAVRRSLDNNSNKLTKSINMLKNKTEKMIYNKLSQLTGVAVDNDEENSESVSIDE